ncbi:MAG: hypothetical protein ACFFDQ_06645 [Candidatus Thorarchaeota archaeon]
MCDKIELKNDARWKTLCRAGTQEVALGVIIGFQPLEDLINLIG